jgi:hypothetical protein
MDQQERDKPFDAVDVMNIGACVVGAFAGGFALYWVLVLIYALRAAS